jgi:hypothetical protein
MKLPKAPDVPSFVDFLGNSVAAGDYVIVGQRDGNMSRMWLGEVFAVNEVPSPYRNHPVELKACVQAVRIDGYSTWSKHDWPHAHDSFTGKSEPTGERPRPTWITCKNMCWYPREISD